MTNKKKHWYDFLMVTTEGDVEAGPVKIKFKRVPVVILLLIGAGLLTAAIYAFKIYMQTPVKIRHHKVEEIRGQLK
jgi:hypothetical protein